MNFIRRTIYNEIFLMGFINEATDLLPAPCQNVLDFFKTVLQHHNQFIQPMSQEQQTEVSKQFV